MTTSRRTALVAATLIVGLWLISRTQATPSPSLLGTWELTSVGGKSPDTIKIKSWQIEFREQGKWLYSGGMTGKYEGMKVSGSGTWLLKGDHLNYTAGANTGQALAHVEHNLLTLSPDPVIRLNGKEPVETRYVKSSR